MWYYSFLYPTKNKAYWQCCDFYEKKDTTHPLEQVNEEDNEEVRKLPNINIIDNTKEEALNYYSIIQKLLIK